LQKIKVAIYGLTTEGYTLASKMVEKASVTIVDDTLQMAMDLDAQMVKSNRTLGQLLGEESLLGLKPISQVLSEAKVVLFAPKLRKTGDESIIESTGKMREVARNISKGGTVINVLPVGVGGNNDNIALIEKQTGMKVGESLNYGYCPLGPGSEHATVASFAKMRDYVIPEDIGLRSTDDSIVSSELAHASSVLNESASIVTEIELMRRARGQRPVTKAGVEKYIDDLASRVYDLTAIQASEDVGEPLTYLAGAALKSLENHARYIVEETRELLRELQLKASKTRVIVAWTVDKYEMRADRLKTAEKLEEKLRDYVTDVRHAQVTVGREDIIDAYKHNVAIACSHSDLEWVKGLKGGARTTELTILKATPALQRG
jgi:hypothetical protein